MFKMFNKRMLKNNKGFTLVELMIVIAIIGILAMVLVPKALDMKKNAKTAGIETNIRMVQATLEGMVDEYTTKSALAAALSLRLGSSITNPFNNANTITSYSTAIADNANPTANSSVVITYQTASDDSATDYDASFATSATSNAAHTYSNMDGTVLVVLYGNLDNLTGARIFGIDANGKPMTRTGKYIVLR